MQDCLRLVPGPERCTFGNAQAARHIGKPEPGEHVKFDHACQSSVDLFELDQPRIEFQQLTVPFITGNFQGGLPLDALQIAPTLS